MQFGFAGGVAFPFFNAQFVHTYSPLELVGTWSGSLLKMSLVEATISRGHCIVAA